MSTRKQPDNYHIHGIRKDPDLIIGNNNQYESYETGSPHPDWVGHEYYNLSKTVRRPFRVSITIQQNLGDEDYHNLSNLYMDSATVFNIPGQNMLNTGKYNYYTDFATGYRSSNTHQTIHELPSGLNSTWWYAKTLRTGGGVAPAYPYDSDDFAGGVPGWIDSTGVGTQGWVGRREFTDGAPDSDYLNTIVDSDWFTIDGIVSNYSIPGGVHDGSSPEGYAINHKLHYQKITIKNNSLNALFPIVYNEDTEYDNRNFITRTAYDSDVSAGGGGGGGGDGGGGGGASDPEAWS